MTQNWSLEIREVATWLTQNLYFAYRGEIFYRFQCDQGLAVCYSSTYIGGRLAWHVLYVGAGTLAVFILVV